MGLVDALFDHKAFHRFESGDIKPRRMKRHDDNGEAMENNRSRAVNLRGTMMPKRVQPPMNISEETKYNLGKVHYHLACLHGTDRFPEMVPSNGESIEEKPSHCISSVIFHLCCAASLGDAPACLALARARIGLDSFVYVQNQYATQMLSMITNFEYGLTITCSTGHPSSIPTYQSMFSHRRNIAREPWHQRGRRLHQRLQRAVYCSI